MIHDVFHFSFTVSDLDASIEWYTEVLGLELVHRQVQDNEYTRTLVAIPGAVLEIAQFRIPGRKPGLSTHMLELVEYRSPPSRKAEVRTSDVAAAHIAFLVTDVHSRYRRLASLGVEFRNPPVEITEGVNRGGFSCYLRDPDGITLELIQPSPARCRELGLPDPERG